MIEANSIWILLALCMEGFFMEWTRAVAIGLLFVLFVATIRLLGDFSPQDKPNRIRFMSRIGVFGAMAAILYAVPVFKFPVPFSLRSLSSISMRSPPSSRALPTVLSRASRSSPSRRF